MAKNIDKTNLRRLAIINEELCKPEKCNQECRRSCPVNRIGKLCIEVDKKAHISESLCIGCSACEKKCPFHAISIINIPTNIDKDCSHRYGSNSFKLHRLPIPRPGKILGLVGTNGIGKSTALKILSGKIKPNLGNFENEPEWQDILKNYRGSELHGYFTKLLENKLTTSNKIQYIDKIPRILEKRYKKDLLTVEFVLNEMDGRNMKEYYTDKFELDCIMSRNLRDLSGGELQRLSLALACMQEAEVYVFDEPTSFLDVKQRLTAAREIRKIAENTDKYVIVVEHDLAILDLMSDYGCVLYGQSGAYGVISAPFSIKAAINIFLDGFIPTENMRFRETALKFNIQDVEEMNKGEKMQFSYPKCSKTYGGVSSKAGEELIRKVKKISIKDSAKSIEPNQNTNAVLASTNSFRLDVTQGNFSNSEITVFLGENGMGKTTLVNLLAGLLTDDTGSIVSSTSSISLKPQKILPKFRGSVRDLLNLKMKARFMDQSFQTEVIKPLKIDYLFDCDISSLSGGELQRIAIVLCLGKDADIYLFDEAAAFLDSDQRIIISKIIKKFIYSKKKSAFVVEHDLVVATYLADRVVVFEGTPGVHSVASEPLDVRTGMNRFLKTLDVTFRRDSTNYRPRVNKPDSSKDREQKATNSYFFT